MIERGSATVEFALLTPLLLVLLLMVVEVAVTARTQLELATAAREGARIAATNPDPARAIEAVRSALGDRGREAQISVRRPHVVGRPATVRVVLTRRLTIPLLGDFGIPLSATTTMLVER